MAFTAKDVQALREKTGCGMMDCKKALTECDGNMDAAADYLREKGLASQAKKASRVAAEGTVCAYTKNGVGAVVEINSETDFVANGDGFKALAADIAEIREELALAGYIKRQEKRKKNAPAPKLQEYVCLLYTSDAADE